MNEKDINYEPDIIFVPVHWYYWLLDYKQKRPDYKRITAMAVLGDLYANSADKDGYIEGDLCFDRQNEGGIFLHKEITSLLDKEYINQKSNRIIVDLITGMAGENKEYGYLAGYLLCEFIFFMDEVQSVDSKKSFHSKFPSGFLCSFWLMLNFLSVASG